LLDTPSNIRTFESLDGLNVITSLLKSRSTSQEVRYAVIELLSFYLGPESPKSRPPSGTKTKDSALGLVGRGREFSLAFEKAQRRQSLVSLPATAIGNSSLISADSSIIEGRNVSGEKEKKKIRSVEEKKGILGRYLDVKECVANDLRDGGEGPFVMPAVAVS
jgi:hypothetical protein